MASANITMGVTGIDKTGAAFNSVRNRAKATGAQIRSVMGGAIAAAGAYLSLRSIKGGIDELGNLSDMAMKAGTSVEFLTKASTAFQIAGLNIGAGQLVRSMQYLERVTGKTGEGAFFDAIESLAKIEDPAKRGAEATRMFGRAALELQPLINGGEEVAQKFRQLQELMPGVGTSAANAGDAAADSLKIFGTGAHNLFLKIVGNIVSMWSEDFPGGIRAGALNAVNWLETLAKKIKAWVARVGNWVGSLGGLIYDSITGNWGSAWEVFQGTLRAGEDDFAARMEAANKSREEYITKLKTLNVDDLAGAFGGGRGTSAAQTAGEEIGTAAAKAAHRVTNQLMLSGSSAANRLAVLGPEYQNETKKQTDLLKKIAQNTEKTAENTDEMGENYTPTDL